MSVFLATRSAYDVVAGGYVLGTGRTVPSLLAVLGLVSVVVGAGPCSAPVAGRPWPCRWVRSARSSAACTRRTPPVVSALAMGWPEPSSPWRWG